MAKQNVTVELFYDGVWNDHTSGVYTRDQITISRGRQNEAEESRPATATLTMDNRSGTYNPKNPTSPLYGMVGRNTPIRIQVDSTTRFVGEVSSWSPQWSVDENDAWTSIEASGILRRLEQGNDALRSPIFREVTSEDNAAHLVAYWPCEDGSSATSIAAGVAGVEPMAIRTDGDGTVAMARYEGIGGSDPLPALTDRAWLNARVPSYPNGETYYRGFFVVPAAGFAGSGHELVRLFDSGGLTFQVNVNGAGSLRLLALDEDGSIVGDTGAIGFTVNGEQFGLNVDLVQDGSDIDIVLATRSIGVDGFTTDLLTWVATFTGLTHRRITHIRVGSGVGFGPETWYTGHHMIGTDPAFAVNLIGFQGGFDVLTTPSVLPGWTGEPAGRRIERLCAEEDIPFASIGDIDRTVVMGPQTSKTFLDLISEAAQTDMGILDDQRFAVGIGYRTRDSLYNQTPVLELDYAANHIAPPLLPVLDDQNTRNDVVARRPDGSESRAVLETGSLSVSEVGRYRSNVEVNVSHDSYLAGQAGWRLHLGTNDETRFPQVTLDLVANPALVTAATTVTTGSRITIENLPDDVSPDLANLLVLGWTETIGSHTRTITFNCVPETPYRIVDPTEEINNRVGFSSLWRRVSTIDSTQTGITFRNEEGPDVVYESNFDIMVGGERMTVTAIGAWSGTYPNRSSTFTVVRSVNGVVKSHPNNVRATLAERSYFGL